jgi:hypothetical protein
VSGTFKRRAVPDFVYLLLSSAWNICIITCMFDNKKPNIILMSDNLSDVLTMTKQFGLQKVAYVLRQAGFEVAVINHLSVFSVAEIKHLLRNLISDQTLFVGVNNFYYRSIEGLVDHADKGIELGRPEPGAILPHHKKYNADIKQLVKKINPNCKWACGGPNQVDAEFNKDFDYVVLGYAEMSIVNLARHLESKQVPLNKSYRSIYGPTILNDPKAQGYDFAQSHMEYAMHDAVLPGETLFLEVGRGCIFNCSFCSYPMNGKKKFDYIRHRDLIVSELKDNYEKFKVTRYMIVDDTFNDSYEKCQMIYEISQMLPFKLEYWAYIRLDLLAARPETIPLLINSGCRAMYFGIETFNPKTATAIRKGGSREKLISTIQQIKDTWGNYVGLHGSFIFGLPHEDVDSIQQTISYLLSDQNLLDSWGVQSLKIKQSGYKTLVNDGFLSDLDQHYTKYGYQDLGEAKLPTVRNSFVMNWQNEHTDFVSMQLLADETNSQGRKNKKMQVIGNTALELSGLDIPLDIILSALHCEVDWFAIDQKKLSRAIEYKKTLFERLGVSNLEKYSPVWDHEQGRYVTFSNYLLAQKQLTLNAESATIAAC